MVGALWYFLPATSPSTCWSNDFDTIAVNVYIRELTFPLRCVLMIDLMGLAYYGCHKNNSQKI